MKKYCILLLLLAGAVAAQAKGFEPLSQWMVFTGEYGYVDNVVNKKASFAGGQEVTATTLMTNGNRVFAVVGKGLYTFDGKQMQALKISGDCFAANSDILSLACDSKNVLWIGTAQGLVKYDGSTFTNIPADVTHLQVITDIVITATDKVYISGMVPGEKGYVGGGVSFFNGANWTNYSKTGSDIPDNLMSDLLLDNNGHLWGIPGKHDMGVATFDGKSWKQLTNGTGLATNIISTIATNSTGKIWLGTSKGIMEQDGAGWSMKPFSNGFSMKLQQYARNGELDVTALAVEENGAVWVGTKSAGLFGFRNGGLKILDQMGSPLVSNAVLKISVDKDGYKWIIAGYKNPDYAQQAPLDRNRNHTYYTSGYGGITAYREHAMIANPKWTVYDSTTSTLDFPSTFSIGEDKSGNIWFPTVDGLVKMNNGTFTKYSSGKLMGNAFVKMYQAPDSKIYLSTTLGAVKVFENGEIKDFAGRPNMGGVTGMTLDKNNVLWVSGTGGISKFANNDWETFNKKDGLPSIIVPCIMKDSNDTLWAGTGKGLVKYDAAWTEVGGDVDFPSNDFTVISEDKAGRLWLGTTRGISIYDRKGYTNIPKIESLDISKFRVNAIYVDKNNIAWIGTENHGLLKYDGTTWTQFSKSTTGGIYDKVTAVYAGADGKVYVSSEISSMNEFDVNLPNQSPEEMQRQELTKRVKMADPRHLLTVIQN